MIFWILGFAIGFALLPKIKPYLHRIYIVPWLWPSVMTIGIGLGLGLGRGCSFNSFDTFSLKELLSQLLPHQVSVSSSMHASEPVTSITPLVATADLDKILGGLKIRRHEDELRERRYEKRQLQQQATVALRASDYTTFAKHGTRKGPFCHLTCAVHHGTNEEHTWDAETLPEFCRANYLPPAQHFPAWMQMLDFGDGGRYERLNPYCGPIPSSDCEGPNEKHPVQSYKLYWKE